jgi:hypothetical protein
LRQATSVIESITAHEDLVSVQLYGHPWVTDGGDGCRVPGVCSD